MQTSEQVEQRAELVQKAQLMVVMLADDTEAVVEARSALRGRISAAHQYGPDWLQDGINVVIQALAQRAEVPQDDEANSEDDAPVHTPPGKKGRRRDANGRDAGDDTGMGSQEQDTPDLPALAFLLPPMH